MKLIDLDNCQTMDYKLNQIADLNGMTPEQYRYYTKGWQTLWGMILKLPIIEPKQEWISCKERLPSKYGKYLVTNRSGYISIETFTSCKREYYPYGYIDDWFDSSDSSWPELSFKRYENNIIAWMPLPKFNEEDEA